MTINIQNKSELLIPVGTESMALTAIHHGADAIYLGFPYFNARGRTEDFSLEQISEIIKMCRLYGVKVHLALNILIFENEFEKLTPTLIEILKLSPDALIVQDLGLINFIRKISPEQIIHASTQMTISNHESIELLQDLNIQRFVLARENSLEEIGIIKSNTDKEIEVFVHGALCVSYSGQCLTSEQIGGRSANRGQCAQSCRFKYDLFVDGKKLMDLEESYLVSPQDLCGINEIPSLIKLGVDSFKVEGRLKGDDYVASVTDSYRKVIDQSKQVSENRLSGNELQKMSSSYSRGFFSGWLHGVNHQELVQGDFNSHRGYYFGKVISINKFKIRLQIELPVELNPGMGILFASKNKNLSQGEKSNETGTTLFKIHSVEPTIVDIEVDNKFNISPLLVDCKVYINSDPQIGKQLKLKNSDRQKQKKILINAEYFIDENHQLEISFDDGKNKVSIFSSDPLEESKSKSIDQNFIYTELSALGGSVFELIKLNGSQYFHDKKYYISAKNIKTIKQQLIQKLYAARTETQSINLNEIKLSPVNEFQSKTNRESKLNILLRNKEQCFAIIQNISSDHPRLGLIILDYEFGRDYEESLNLLRKSKFQVGIATTRILKPKEYNNLKLIEKLQPDAILVRNLGALNYFNKSTICKADLLGDFSLNTTNSFTFNYLISKNLKSLCLSYDLNHQQSLDLLKNISSEKAEITLHQYMPSFHMEHCVFAAFLSEGKSFKDCGKPCENHHVMLKDQFQNSHFIKPDHECRNTMYSAEAQSAGLHVQSWIEHGVSLFRYEALNEESATLLEKLTAYLQFLNSEISLKELQKVLKTKESYGVTNGRWDKKDVYSSRKN